MREIKTRGHFPNDDAATELILLIVSLLDAAMVAKLSSARTVSAASFERHNQFIVIYSGSGTNTGAPLFLTKNAMNFAGLVLLAFLPTT